MMLWSQVVMVSCQDQSKTMFRVLPRVDPKIFTFSIFTLPAVLQCVLHCLLDSDIRSAWNHPHTSCYHVADSLHQPTPWKSCVFSKINAALPQCVHKQGHLKAEGLVSFSAFT